MSYQERLDHLLTITEEDDGIRPPNPAEVEQARKLLNALTAIGVREPDFVVQGGFGNVVAEWVSNRVFERSYVVIDFGNEHPVIRCVDIAVKQ